METSHSIAALWRFLRLHADVKIYRDALNEAELMGVRALCWGAFVFAVKEIISTSMPLSASEMTGNVLCVVVLLALLMSQRPLFRGVAKGVGERVSIASAAALRRHPPA